MLGTYGTSAAGGLGEVCGEVRVPPSACVLPVGLGVRSAFDASSDCEDGEGEECGFEEA